MSQVLRYQVLVVSSTTIQTLDDVVLEYWSNCTLFCTPNKPYTTVEFSLTFAMYYYLYNVLQSLYYCPLYGIPALRYKCIHEDEFEIKLCTTY